MQEVFDSLKAALSTAPILVHFDSFMPAIVEADASDFAFGGVLSQKGKDGKIHPIAFHSRKLSPPEMNYEIHDKQLLAIVDCFKRWRQFLEGALHRIEVFSDHHNVEYLTKVRLLNGLQARWSQELGSYNFIITYRSGKNNDKADILSRLPQHKPEKVGEEDQPVSTVFKPSHFSPSVLLTSARLCSLSTRRWDADFLRKVKDAGIVDDEYTKQYSTTTIGRTPSLWTKDFYTARVDCGYLSPCRRTS